MSNTNMHAWKVEQFTIFSNRIRWYWH